MLMLRVESMAAFYRGHDKALTTMNNLDRSITNTYINIMTSIIILLNSDNKLLL